jgi:hypothetical protein
MKGKMKPKQTKSLYLALTLLALSMLALSLLAPLCSGSSQKWKWYENKDWGFKIKYPEDWCFEIECIDPPNSNPTNTEIKKADAVNFQFTTLMYEAIANIAIGKTFPSELCNPETGFGLDLLVKDPTCYKVLEYGNITLGGQPAKKLIFLKETKKVGKLKQMVISTCYKKKYFEIIFSGGNIGEGTYKNWNKYIDVAEQMIKSFEFI